jgi:hypothetical protein
VASTAASSATVATVVLSRHIREGRMLCICVTHCCSHTWQTACEQLIGCKNRPGTTALPAAPAAVALASIVDFNEQGTLFRQPK